MSRASRAALALALLLLASFDLRQLSCRPMHRMQAASDSLVEAVSRHLPPRLHRHAHSAPATPELQVSNAVSCKPVQLLCTSR